MKNIGVLRKLMWLRLVCHNVLLAFVKFSNFLDCVFVFVVNIATNLATIVEKRKKRN